MFLIAVIYGNNEITCGNSYSTLWHVTSFPVFRVTETIGPNAVRLASQKTTDATERISPASFLTQIWISDPSFEVCTGPTIGRNLCHAARSLPARVRRDYGGTDLTRTRGLPRDRQALRFG